MPFFVRTHARKRSRQDVVSLFDIAHEPPPFTCPGKRGWLRGLSGPLVPEEGSTLISLSFNLYRYLLNALEMCEPRGSSLRTGKKHVPFVRGK